MIQALTSKRPRTRPEELAKDRRLVERVCAGDQDAEDEFVNRMCCIPRFIEKHGRHSGLVREELADLAQDVFAIIWRKLSDYRGEAPLEAWAHSFCVHSLSNLTRKQGRRPLTAGSDHLAEWPSPCPPEGDPRLVPLRAALLNLPTPHQQILRLHAMQGLTYQEIAGHLDCSPRAARARYQRALIELRALLNISPSRAH